MKIENLSPIQKELCDKIWSMDSEQELVIWVNSLPRNMAIQAYAMIQMILHAYMDEMDLGDCEEAKSVLERISGLSRS